MKTLYIYTAAHQIDHRPRAHSCSILAGFYFDWQPPSYGQHENN